MTMETNSNWPDFATYRKVGTQNDYQKGLKLAEAGKHAEALTYIQTHLQRAPQDFEALNDAGAILHCLGRSDEAIEHLAKARALKPKSTEILWNLAESYLAAGKAKEGRDIKCRRA